ncbi:hypothetical protein VTI74DRAFT_663 [Chaetomium olivicolor]
MKWACRTGCIAAIDTALRLGASISAVPVASVATKSKPVAVVGGGSSGSNRANKKRSTATGDAVIIKALTLQLAAKGRQVETFSRLVSLGARLDEPGTSIASIRSLIRLVTQGPDASALLRSFFTSGAGLSTSHLAHQLGQEMRNEALIGLLQGCTPPRLSQEPSLDEYVDFARALLDAGASPDLFRGSALRSTSTLSTAVRTLSPDLVRLLLDRGACPDGPTDLQPPPVPRLPLHIPLCAVAHALATSLLDPPAQAALRQIADMLLDSGADINVCVPYLQPNRWDVSFTSPLLVFLDAVDCWDDHGGGPQDLDTLQFLLDRGSSPDGPPRHPAYKTQRPHITHPALLRGGRYHLGPARLDPIRDLLDNWGVNKLASPAFASAIELLVGHPSRRGGLRAVAEALTKYDYSMSPSPSSSSSPDAIITTKNDDAILVAWSRVMSSTARLLAPHELGEFLYAYVVRKGTCPKDRPLCQTWGHRSGEHHIGDLARVTVAVLLDAGADVNYRHRPVASRRREERQQGDGNGGQEDGPTALHAICIWLAGRAPEENCSNRWKPPCWGFRHTPRRTWFNRFLVETCGADPGARYQGRTPAEILVQLRRPELDAEETTDVWGRDAGVVREGRQALVALLENAPNATSCS